MYLNNSNKELCSGCTACYNVCPVNAIKMIEDREEFWKDYSKNDFEFIINKYAK